MVDKERAQGLVAHEAPVDGPAPAGQDSLGRASGEDRHEEKKDTLEWWSRPEYKG